MPRRLGALIACLALAAPATAAEPIAEHLAKLTPLIGSWNATATVYPRGGQPVSTAVDHTIESALGGTYLRWEAVSKGTALPSFVLMITYDSRAQAFRQTYFYAGTAFWLTETGQFDDATHEYRTTARIEGAAGGRDYRP